MFFAQGSGHVTERNRVRDRSELPQWALALSIGVIGVFVNVLRSRHVMLFGVHRMFRHRYGRVYRPAGGLTKGGRGTEHAEDEDYSFHSVIQSGACRRGENSRQATFRAQLRILQMHAPYQKLAA